jgi:hypothetical protein
MPYVVGHRGEFFTQLPTERRLIEVLGHIHVSPPNSTRSATINIDHSVNGSYRFGPAPVIYL